MLDTTRKHWDNMEYHTSQPEEALRHRDMLSPKEGKKNRSKNVPVFKLCAWCHPGNWQWSVILRCRIKQRTIYVDFFFSTAQNSVPSTKLLFHCCSHLFRLWAFQSRDCIFAETVSARIPRYYHAITIGVNNYGSVWFLPHTLSQYYLMIALTLQSPIK